ncbi:MAG: thiamine pyrophosphate-binding protein [Solirubrobacteraceae bacterium]
MKLYEQLASTLTQSGVEHVFTVTGDGNLELIDALARRGVHVIHARHEQGAVAMAEGYSRARGGALGVCSVTTGAGLTQTATSLATARGHGSAVLLLAGHPPVAHAGAVGELDQRAFGALAAGAAYTLWNARATAGTISAIVSRLRHGPVVLNLPVDVQREEVGDGGSSPSLVPHRRFDWGLPAPDAVAAATAMLRKSRRPLIVAGRGAVVAGAGPAIARLADVLGARIATTLSAHGLCADHPRQIGVIGSLGDGRATHSLPEADCIFAVGATLGPFALMGQRIAVPTIRVDVDEARLAGDAADVAVLGDVRRVTETVLAELEVAGHAPADSALPPAAARPTAFDDGEGTVDPRRALLALDAALDHDRRLVIDGGHFAIFASQLLTVHAPEQFIFTSDFGAIGQGLATAIGAAIGAPEPRTTLVVGDGGLLMAIAELETAARYGVPLTMFVMNDGAYGQERHNMAARGLDPSLAILPTPDLAAMARSAGADGRQLRSPADLDSLRTLVADAVGPLLLDVRINGDVLNPTSVEIARTLGGGE